MEQTKLSLKLLIALVLNPDGLPYKQIAEKTNFHINTVSRYISYLDSKGLVDIQQRKSESFRGRKWVNIVKLKKQFLEAKTIQDFFIKLIKQLDGSLNAIFSD